MSNLTLNQDLFLSLSFPKGNSTYQISIINITCNIIAPSYYLVELVIKGHEWLNLPTYLFYIKHKESGKQILFNLGSRKDWQNNCLPVMDVISQHIPALKVDKDIIEILKKSDVDTKDIKALILSY